MKKSIYLFTLALGASTLAFAQNIGINNDGSTPDSDALLHVKDDNADSCVVRVENEQATLTKFELRNTSTNWDLRIPTGTTDLRINNGSGQDQVTIQNDGDVGIQTTSPVSDLDINGSLGLKVTTISAATTLDETYNVVLCNTGTGTVELPGAASSTGRVYYIKNIDSGGGDVTIDGKGANIDGSATYVLDCENDVIRIVSNGSNWFILDRDTGTCVPPTPFVCGDAVSFTYNGSSVTYGSLVSPTGECWLDRNLGASQVATSSTDHLAYGDLFQWGRKDDGHQEITWTNSTTGTAVNGTTTTPDDSPNHALFITVVGATDDWRVSSDDNLWNGESATNNPCPSGWRIPTQGEWAIEITSESITNSASAYSSSLKLVTNGARSAYTGALEGLGTSGRYWSSTVSAASVNQFNFWSSGVTSTATYMGRAFGLSIRCIKD